MWKNLFQFLRRNHFELCIGAVGWFFIAPPSSELCGMTKAAALHVVVSDFHYKFGSQRLPGQVLALTPTALATRHALDTFIAGISMICPLFPRVTGKRVSTIGFEEFCKFLALFGAETRTNPDMLQCPGIVKEAQQQ